MSVHIGTAGWSYPQGQGKWDGLFYPSGLADRDKLEYYAGFFDSVEVNSSFYRPLNPRVAQGWVERTRPDFRFCVKLWNKFTHPKMYEEATGRLERPSAEDCDTVDQGLEPLASSGKLGALLAQFPASFKASDDTISYLDELLRRFAAYPLAVELRHRSWSDSHQVRNLLEEGGIAWAMIDEPKFRTSVREVPLTSRLGYFRFHGRNAEQWWRGDREARYNYLYSPTEQEGLAEDVRDISDRTAETYVFYNNHFRAKAVVNALQLKHALGEPVDAAPTPRMLAEYPDLAKLVGHRESKQV